MDLIVAGLSHRTAPIDLRERIALSPDEVPVQLARLVGPSGFPEALLLSTCNRTEVYCRAGANGGDDGGAARAALDFLATLKPGLNGAVREHLYVREGDDAVRHLFRVASGLDSMVVGESEIARQMSEAYAVACKVGTAGPLLHRAFPRALQVGKQVRTETEITRGAASVAGAAVALAERVFRDVSTCRVLTVGAGETVETALRALAPKSGKLVVLNRTLPRAERLAALHGGTAGTLAEFAKHVVEADIVVAATSAPEALVRKAELSKAIARRDRALLILDLGVPRDVEPGVRDLDNVYLHDVDDLRAISDRALEQRALEVPKAEAIVASAVTEFRRRRRQLEAEPAIRALLDGLLSVRRDVLGEDAGSVTGTAAEKSAAERATGRLVDKLMRRLAPRLKDGTASPREILDAFGIEAPQAPHSSDDADDAGTARHGEKHGEKR